MEYYIKNGMWEECMIMWKDVHVILLIAENRR